MNVLSNFVTDSQVRLVLFPGLLFVFRDLPLPQWESIIIWTLQLGLCVFNIGMVHRRCTYPNDPFHPTQ